MALTPEELAERLQLMALSPKSTTTDSGTVVARDGIDAKELLNDAATETALLNDRSAFDCLRTRRITGPGAYR